MCNYTTYCYEMDGESQHIFIPASDIQVLIYDHIIKVPFWYPCTHFKPSPMQDDDVL